MRPRFFAPSLDPARPEVVLPADESRHLTRVLRLEPGDEVELFDGSGREFTAVILSVDRGSVSARLVEPLDRGSAAAVPVVLAQAVLKPGPMDDVVRDATMIGVAAIVPLLTSHMAVPARAASGGRAVERWRRVALASAKQCRRATLPEVRNPVPFDVWLAARRASRDVEPTLLLVEPSAGVQARSLKSLLGDPRPRGAALAVGPEGGWSPAEVAAAAEAGVLLVTLGALTLRADAAAFVALSGLAVVWS